jgi:hypothetical protein
MIDETFRAAAVCADPDQIAASSYRLLKTATNDA